MTHPSTPPTVPPEGTSWGRVALFGCLGLLVVGVLAAAIGAAAWWMIRDPAPASLEEGAVGDREITVVGPGESIHRGTLAAGDRTRPDGSWYDAYNLEATVGERIVIVMESTDFDAYLTLVSPGAEQYSDDDSGGGTDARLELEIDESGTWTVMANAWREGEEGAYTLRIERGSPGG